jgi:hypothetical protein
LPKSADCGIVGDVADPITILSSGSLSALLVYMVNSWYKSSIEERIKRSIQLSYDKELETYRDKLKSQSDIEITKLKADLEIAANERNVRLTQTFDEMASVIAETYKRLVAMMDASTHYSQLIGTDFEEQQRRLKFYQEKSDDFILYFRPRKIYLPSATAEKVRLFSFTVNSATRKFGMANSGRQTRDTEIYNKLFDDYFATSKEIPKLLEALEADFQDLFGFSKNQKKESF